jgi:HD-GYP domain-containing protein (c-di-GMP phosphodiesterase class II)
MAAISLGADMGMGAPLETGLATCVVAVALARRLGLDDDLIRRTHDLALLQHVGCTATSAETADALGDELVMRAHAATLDFGDKRQMARFMLSHVARTNAPMARPAALVRAVARGGRLTASAPDVCETARMLAARFGYDAANLVDLDGVYEYWDGSGFPGRADGADIALPARIVHAATLAVAANQEGGLDAAVSLVSSSAGHRLDPAVTEAFLRDPDKLFAALDRETSLWDAVVAADPGPGEPLEPEAVDECLRAVADFVDLKSPYLRGHSSGVATLAASAAEQAGFTDDRLVAVRRAGWLHDLGRIGVSSTVWAHEGKLTAHQWEQVRLHPYYTGRILSHTPFLSGLATIATAHHERLDGSGYHRGATAPELSAAARLLAVADAFHSKLEERPHRAALSPAEAAQEIRAGVDAARFDGDAADAVLAAAGQPTARRTNRVPGGLTPREVETLRLVARGLTTRQIARAMTIAPKTADGNIQRIYAKIGVSTRAGATVYALQHDLVVPG